MKPCCNLTSRRFEPYNPGGQYSWGDGSTSKMEEGPTEGQIVCDFDTSIIDHSTEYSLSVLKEVSYLLVAHRSGVGHWNSQDCRTPMTFYGVSC